MGVGTTFFIYLPASEKEVAVPEPVRMPESRLPDIGKRKILIMDDEEIIRHVAGLMLSRLGHDAEFAEDGTEAIVKLLEIDPDVKAIISSGYSLDPVMANLKQYGFSGAMAKPYTRKELSDVLYNVISEKNGEKTLS